MSSPPQPPPTPVFIQQSNAPITHLLFSRRPSSNDLLYSGNRNGDFTIYNCKYRRPVFTANVIKKPLLSVVELEKENALLTHCRNGAVFKWTGLDSADLIPQCVYEKEAYTFCRVCVNESKNLLFIPSIQSSTIDCVDMSTYSVINQLKVDQPETRGMLMNMQSIDAQEKLIAGYESGDLVSFDVRKFSPIVSAQMYKGQPLMCFDFSASKGVGVCASAAESTHLTQFGSDLTVEARVEITNPGVNSIAIRHTDAKLVATGGWDARVRMFTLKKLKPLVVLDFHKSAINTVDFSPSNFFAAGSNDSIISFWNLYQ